MCGCDCCQNNNPTCFDPQSMEVNGSFHGWACRCSCPGCIARIIDGAVAVGYKTGYGAAMDDGWGEPGHIKEAVAAERERIRVGVMDFYRVAPLAAEPMLRVIEDREKS